MGALTPQESKKEEWPEQRKWIQKYLVKEKYPGQGLQGLVADYSWPRLLGMSWTLATGSGRRGGATKESSSACPSIAELHLQGKKGCHIWLCWKDWGTAKSELWSLGCSFTLEMSTEQRSVTNTDQEDADLALVRMMASQRVTRVRVTQATCVRNNVKGWVHLFPGGNDFPLRLVGQIDTGKWRSKILREEIPWAEAQKRKLSRHF